MKKIFTLLLAMGSLTMVFAQSGRYGTNDRHGNNDQTQSYHQNAQTQSYHQNTQTQSYHEYSQPQYNRGGYERGNERVVIEHRNDRRNNYFSYSRPSRNHWNDRSYGRRDFRNREW